MIEGEVVLITSIEAPTLTTGPRALENQTQGGHVTAEGTQWKTCTIVYRRRFISFQER